MAYYNREEHDARRKKFADYLRGKDIDFGLVYYDETNVANGWYLTAWCPQFENGCVLVSSDGQAMILGGPESEPFARQESAIAETRNLPVFMVPDEEYPMAEIIGFDDLFAELSTDGSIKRVGIVGMDSMPFGIHNAIAEAFRDVELIDITDDFLEYRVVKSPWETAQIQKAFALADLSYDAMTAKIAHGVYEYEVAAAGEAASRSAGADSFAFRAIVGSGTRANAVVPTASNKRMQAGETVMLGIAPRFMGYTGVFGHTLPVSGTYTPAQADSVRRMQEVMIMTRDNLKPGMTGRELDKFGRAHYDKHGLSCYIVCPFAHTIGLMEAEAPFFGPNSDVVILPGMAICVDVSFFGHPELNGMRIETGYSITEKGAVPFSPKIEKILLSDI
ncbi:MAG: Xaa-Pro peptidase family protein [Eubacteriales bacterium]|nr:Xaa-Pro peptidase family protein [Eubacteriales bacterium]